MAKITTATSRPATQYTDALNDLTAAQASIDAGETAIDKAGHRVKWITHRFRLLMSMLSLHGSKATRVPQTMPQLAAIVAKREVAVSYISNANDAITSGNFDQARSKAG